MLVTFFSPHFLIVADCVPIFNLEAAQNKKKDLATHINSVNFLYARSFDIS